MTRSYVTAAEARSMPGLRIAFSAGMPGPWGEAVRCIFDIKKIDYVPVMQVIGEANEELQAWTGQSSAYTRPARATTWGSLMSPTPTST